jgi:uncharacterized protein with von Willebrand factor type A (vWA) domain
MQSFIDLEGASGATYRFQRVDDVALLPAIAGNFAYVQEGGPKPLVVCCGTDDTLLKAAASLPAAQQTHKATAIYIRRNVSWRVRASEHADIVNKHRPSLVLATELDGAS